MGYQTDSVNVVCVIVWNTNIVFCFSRMRSKGSRFTLGVWGLRVCSLDVAFMFAAGNLRNRSQPFVTVYRRAYGKFCKRGRLWRFHMWRCFVSRGRRGTSWHSDVFCNMSKVVLCGRRNTFAYFCDIFRRCVAVFAAGATLWTCPSSFCVAGAAL